ncbi:50S ribosomal protein L35 [Candidatus Roizmanbacteria bacterium CG_4_10_14_0_2_um_filter_36_9]|uniref:Large ribosomal subunit protein bL35 n=1 Tax=Candidatus Roizmanbacteria bacterium CG_4_10_14_0_2_um_filter_36_9 TaxID=1974823 RepID=A0A2M7U597_9BACT|nr:MAG: 50S ribosomal protein L35 [Candidatus Roizmanbacteria bacterium CG_4_10_14_0_2_um_filter_36_9]
MKNKQKTHKGSSKRFKITSTGKVLHRSKGARHLNSKKTKRQLRKLKIDKPVEGRVKIKIKKLLGLA